MTSGDFESSQSPCENIELLIIQLHSPLLHLDACEETWVFNNVHYILHIRGQNYTIIRIGDFVYRTPILEVNFVEIEPAKCVLDQQFLVNLI